MEETEIISGWYLKRITAAGIGKEIIALKENELTLGRSNCFSPHISRKHAQFHKTIDNDLFIKDLKSVNGTFLNKKRIVTETFYPIKHGDTIILGKEDIKCVDDYGFELCFASEPAAFQVVKNPKVRGLHWLTYLKDGSSEAQSFSENPSILFSDRSNVSLRVAVKRSEEAIFCVSSSNILVSPVEALCIGDQKENNLESKQTFPGTSGLVSLVKESSDKSIAVKENNRQSRQTASGISSFVSPVVKESTPDKNIPEKENSLDIRNTSPGTSGFMSSVVKKPTPENIVLVKSKHRNAVSSVSSNTISRNYEKKCEQSSDDLEVVYLSEKLAFEAKPKVVTADGFNGEHNEKNFLVSASQRSKYFCSCENEQRKKLCNITAKFLENGVETRRCLNHLVKPCSIVLNRCDDKIRSRTNQKRDLPKESKLASVSNASESDDSETSDSIISLKVCKLRHYRRKNPFVITSDDETTNQFKKRCKQSLRRISSDDSDNDVSSPVCESESEIQKQTSTFAHTDLPTNRPTSESDVTSAPEQEPTINCEVIENTNQISVLDRVKEEQNDSDFGMSYSQIDEVITISSDDDDDIAFPSAKCGEELQQIKLEPISDDEQCCEEQVDVSENSGLLDVYIADDELKKSLIWPSDSPTREGNDYSDFFPILSQAFNDEESTASTMQAHEVIACNNVVTDNIDQHASTSKSKSKELDDLIEKNRQRRVSRITYTDPLPQVNNRRRGHYAQASDSRVENFYGKEVADLQEWTSRTKRRGKVVAPSKGKQKNKQGLKQKIKEQFSHRIPIPGGGSAIRSGPAIEPGDGARILRTSEHISSSSKSSKRKVPDLPANSSNAATHLPKKAPKLTTEQRFASRQSSLIEDMAKEKTTSSGKVLQNTLPASRIPHNALETCQDGTSTISTRSHNFPTHVAQLSRLTTGKQDSAEVKKNVHVVEEISHKPIESLKSKVRFSENVSVREIPSLSDSRKCVSERSVHDPRLVHGTAQNNFSKQPAPNTIPRKNASKYNTINRVVSWKAIWLKEQSKMKDPPPVVKMDKLHAVHFSYDSFDDYCNTYYRLLMLEMWHSVYKDWCDRGSEKPYLRLYMLGGPSTVNDRWEFCFQAVVADARTENDTIFMEGHLITLWLIDSTSGEKREVFGYVTDHKSELLANSPTVSSLLQNVAMENKTGRLVTLTVVTQRKHFTVNENVPVRGTMVSYIKPLIRQADAIVTLFNSLLIRDILCPRKEFFSVHSAPDTHLEAFGNFNVLQRAAILGAASAILRPFPIPQIQLFQGPPGTGKTNMIVGLIQHLVHPSISPQKLLVVCASNGAVDEIARRLMKIRPVLIAKNPSWRLRLVRVGQPSQICMDVKPISAEELAHKNQRNAIDIEIKRVNDTIASLQNRILSEKSKAELDRLQDQMATACRQLHFFEINAQKVQAKPISHKSDVFKTKLREILGKANVILSTLNSCRQNILETTFGRKGSPNFTCCIVDEATQCTEPELLTALQYGVSKLILVGDPKQLPATVLSTKATQLKYSISLFERLYNYFRQYGDQSPVFMLTEQYRMHSEICWFPSYHFYSRRLQTPPFVDKKMESFPLKPYICINMFEGKETTSNGMSFENAQEVEFVVRLCRLLDPVLPRNTSVGIITPYQGQRQLFLKSFKSEHTQQNCSIDVNTVDGFQGREKDIVILSCVRSGKSIGFLGSSKRLNVAITRARKCLLICGCLHFLQEHSHWQELIHDAKRRNLIVNVTPADNVKNVLKKIQKHPR